MEEKDKLFEYDAGCQFKLDNFEGPLDLLLHLIKESKMEIFEVKLADITEQYLQYLSSIDQLDMEKASDFIEVAAILIEIKSKSLLPKPEPEVVDEEDDETRLLRQLQEYKIFKEACERLRQYENVNRLYKKPDETVGDYRVILQNMEIEGLLNAFANVLTRITIEKKEIEPKKIVKDRWTVAEKVASIKNMVTERHRFKFTDLFDENYSKSEVINVFLALLELLKMQFIKVIQNNEDNDIDIMAREEEDGQVG